MPLALTPGFAAILQALAARGPVVASGNAWHCRCPCPGHRNDDARPSGRVWVENDRVCVKCFRHDLGHGYKEWRAAIGLPDDAWRLNVKDGESKNYKPRAPEIVAWYVYRDDQGKELFRVARCQPKAFFQTRRLALDADTEVTLLGLNAGWYVDSGRGWRYHGADEPPAEVGRKVYAPAAQRALYRLPELLASPFEEPVYFTEGEKAADCLAGLGLVATCHPHGAGNLTMPPLVYLEDRHVVVLPDNDAIGYKHAATVAGGAIMAGAASVRVVRWQQSELTTGQDVYDWVRLSSGQDPAADLYTRCCEPGVDARAPRHYTREGVI